MSSHTLIVGAGRSAYGAAQLLRKHGRTIRISDTQAKYPEEIARLEQAGVQVILGPQTKELLEDCSQLIVSPGLSPDIPLLAAARDLGIPIRSEIDLALDYFKGSIISVTGTNGKSTTTSLIAHMLASRGHSARASGNIGIPPSLLLAEGQAPDIFVLELSSYQLDFSQPLHSRCSVFLSFSEDHMERHKTMANYFAAKWKLITATDPDGLCIMPCSILDFAARYRAPRPKASIVQIVIDGERPARGVRGLKVHLDSERGRVHGDGIRGERYLPKGLSFHNQLNALTAAIAVQTIAPTAWDLCMESLSSFPWLPYRFEKIGAIQGFHVYNDSKSTNVESTLMALRSVNEKAILMLGGFPKGESFKAIEAHRDKIGTLVAFGQAAPIIARDLALLQPLCFPSLREALEQLPFIFARRPAPLVFSPACSSFDEFKNFEERGAFFNQNLQNSLDPND